MCSLLEELKEISGRSTEGILADFSDKQLLKDTINRLEEAYDIDILVNNAGFGYMGEFYPMAEDKIESMVEVNVSAVVSLCRAFLPKMTKKQGTGILNVGSIASFFSTPLSTLYGATKYFVLSFTDGLHMEMLPFGVHISGLYPGHTATNFIERASGGKKKKWDKAIAAGEVADLALDGLRRNKARIIPGVGNKMRFFASRVLPARIISNKIYASAVKNYGDDR